MWFFLSKIFGTKHLYAEQNETKFIVIGASGAGKSTLINTFTNYFKDGKPTSLFVSIETAFLRMTELFGIGSETNAKDRSVSQTKECKTYSFKKNGEAYSIIDTPGTNDVSGVQQDEENISKILEAASKSSGLNAIVLVMNGSNPRICSSIKSVLVKFRSTLPDSVTDNVILVLTNCRKSSCNFDINSLSSFVKIKEVFYFNNSFFSSDPKTWNDDEKEMMKMEFNASMKTCKDLMSTIRDMKTVSTADFEKIRKIRNEIKFKLDQAKLNITNLQNLQEQYEKAQQQKELAEKDEKSNENFKIDKQVRKVVLSPRSYHSTLCSKCQSTCHEACGLQETNENSRQNLVNCLCMGRTGNCQICTGQCDYTSHYHSRHVYEETMVNVEEEIEKMKQEYIKAKNIKETAVKEIDQLSLSRQSIESKVDSLKKDVREECCNLKKICKNYNLVDELYLLIEMLKKESKNLTSLEARKNAESFILAVEEIVKTV